MHGSTDEKRDISAKEVHRETYSIVSIKMQGDPASGIQEVDSGLRRRVR
jgi:hypothetical protein